MAETRTDGGPAFPLPPYKYGDQGQPLYEQDDQDRHGMSLRDYFAAKALACLMTEGEAHYADIARRAYQMADWMLKARG